jgi:hypothetical protein
MLAEDKATPMRFRDRWVRRLTQLQIGLIR